jgi:hypothetical protein
MRAAAVTLATILAVAGCGDERAFEPEEFVDAMNAEGAGLVLGEPLTSIEEGVDVYALEFEEEPGEHEEPEAGGHGHSGGSMTVTEDAEAARAEHARCEEAVSLVCYRAANVVLFFDLEPSDEHVARVDAAVRALASEG